MGFRKKPPYHREKDAVSDQLASLQDSLPTSAHREQAPNGPESEDRARSSQAYSWSL